MRKYNMYHVVAGGLNESQRHVIQDVWNKNLNAPKCHRKSIRAIAKELGLPSSPRVFDTKVYSTRACAAWEKGSVENANRLLRRWFPKSTDFSRVTPAEVAIAEEGVNSIHRRSLDGLTANQAFARAA